MNMLFLLPSANKYFTTNKKNKIIIGFIIIDALTCKQYFSVC